MHYIVREIKIQNKTRRQTVFYAIGRNMNKYHRFLHGEIQKFEGKEEQKTA